MREVSPVGWLVKELRWGGQFLGGRGLWLGVLPRS